MMLSLPLLVSLALCLPQDATAPPNAGPPRATDAWKELDRVVVIVNEDIFTQRSLQKDLARIASNQRLEGKSAIQQAQSEILTQRVRERVWVQAGQDLGVDQAQVGRIVKDKLSRLEERYEGVAGLSEFLKSRDLDANQAREEVEFGLYSDLWDGYVTGDGPTALGRVSRDTYVRPGLCRFHYRNVLASPRDLSQIGGRAQEVVLQLLILDPRQFDDAEKGRELATQLRQRIVDGADMAELNERYGAVKQNGGKTEPVDESRVNQIDPALGEFLRDARAGDVSQVLEYHTEKHSTWRFVRLVDRTAPAVPEFTSPEVQRKLMQTLKDGRREYRREEAFKRLLKGSYIWPRELVGP